MGDDTDPELEALRKRKLQQLRMFIEKEKGRDDLPSTTISVTDMDFQETVSKYPLVLVDFWAPWCSPCKMIGPILEQLAGEYRGRAVIAKLNVDNNQRTANSFGVQSIPTLILFKDGRPVDRVTGALPRSALKNLIERYLQ